MREKTIIHVTTMGDRHIHPSMRRMSNKKLGIIIWCVTALFLYLMSNATRQLTRDPAPEPVEEEAVEVRPPIWMIFIPINAMSIGRRAIIRNTWQAMYHRNFLTFRFFVGRVEPRYERFIEYENTQHGDIISLPWIDDVPAVVNSIKPAECFEYIYNNNMYHTFVSKLDDDAFLNVPDFWRDYLGPRLETPEGSYLIAKNVTPSHHVPYLVPGGQFYTLTWDLVESLVEEYPRHPRLEYMEAGPHTGFLLSQANAEFEFVGLENDVAFDYDSRGTNSGAWSHRIMDGAMNPHKLETDAQYLEAASYFDEQGLDMERIRVEEEEEEERRTQSQLVDSGRQAQADTGRQAQDTGRVQGVVDTPGRPQQVESDSVQGPQGDNGRVTHAQVDSGRVQADRGKVQVDSGRTQAHVDSGRNHAVDNGRGAIV